MKKLVNEVKHLEINHNRFGYFLEINEDLNKFLSLDLVNSNKKEDKLLVMAYAYARRAAAAGLFLQGIFTKNEYKHAYIMFQTFQLQTGHSVEFQEDAFAQALEYMNSYDKRFTRKVVSNLIMLADVVEDNIYYNGDEKLIKPYNQVINLILMGTSENEK